MSTKRGKEKSADTSATQHNFQIMRSVLYLIQD